MPRQDSATIVAENVKRLRLQRKWSQEDCAEKCDLHRTYVGSVKRGERDIGIIALGRLVRALGVSLAEFFQPFRQRPR